MIKETEVENLIALYGQNELARRLGVPSKTIKKWKLSHGRVPEKHRQKLTVVQAGGTFEPMKVRRDGLPILPKKVLGIFPRDYMRPMTELALFVKADWPNGHTSDFEGSILQTKITPALKALEE